MKEEIIDKLEQISESIEIIQERCKDYHSLDNFLKTPWGNDRYGGLYHEVASDWGNNQGH